MFYSKEARDIRNVYIEAWNKQKNNQVLSDLERQICQVIAKHPEYQKFLTEKYSETVFQEVNPFLHMGLHIALHEQIQTNRPFGIQAVYQQLLIQFQDPHRVEHMMMEILERILWQAQQHQSLPDEKLYLEACQELSGFR